MDPSIWPLDVLGRERGVDRSGIAEVLRIQARTSVRGATDAPRDSMGGGRSCWVVLAIEVFILYVLLRPRTFSRSVHRLDRAATVSAIGCVFLAIAIPTEVRGHYHVPVWFAFLAACVLGIWTATLRFTGGAGTDDVESPKQAG